MRDGKTSRSALTVSWSAILLTVVATSAAVIAATAAHAQAPWSGPDEQSAAPPAPAAASPKTEAEDLPWLATTNSAGTPARAPSDKNPAKAETKPGAKVDGKKTANAALKCEAQAEDGCRAVKTCAWVAAIPQPDGKMTPARCAERKVNAQEKKPKPIVAAKPKPKQESTGAVTKNETTITEAVPPKDEPSAQPKSEAKAATPPAVTEPVVPPVDTAAPQANTAAPVAAEAPKTADVPFVMLPRAPVPFLPPEPAQSAVPTVSPTTEATPIAAPVAADPAPIATPAVANPAPDPQAVAADAPQSAARPLSVPGLVIVE